MNRHSPLHPLSVWYRFRRGLPLLLVPLLRLLRGDDTLTAVLSASLWELAAAALLFLWALLCHRRQRLTLTDRSVILCGGILWHRRLWLPGRQVAAYQTELSPLMALCGASRLSLFPAGKPRSASAVLVLPRRTSLGKEPLQPRGRSPLFTRLFPTLILAASSSNAALGLLALVPAVRSLRWLTADLPRRMLEGVEQTVPLPLPPVLALVADVFLLGWLFAFLRGIWYYAGFSARREGAHLRLTTGLITRRDTQLELRHITALQKRQTLLTTLFGLCTLSASVAGYGRDEPIHPVLLPAARRHTLAAEAAALLPDWPLIPAALRPAAKSRLRYARLPLIWLIGALLLMTAGGWLMPAGSLAVLFGGWWLLIRLLGWHRAGIGRENGYVTLCYPKGLGLYEQQFRETAITQITVRRSPWQRLSGQCDVTVCCRGDRRRHKVVALPYDAVCDMLDIRY